MSLSFYLAESQNRYRYSHFTKPEWLNTPNRTPRDFQLSAIGKQDD
jgi:hypothetical protein